MSEGFSTETGGNYVRVTRGLFLLKDQHGDFELIADDGTKTMFKSNNTFRGSLVGIDTKEGKHGWQWIFKLRAGMSVYLFAFTKGSLTAQGFLNALANLGDYQNLTLKSWSKDGAKTSMTSIYVYKGNEQAEWKWKIDELPPVPDLIDSKGRPVMGKHGKPQKDDEERVKFFDIVIAQINKRLGYTPGVNEDTGEISDEGFVQELESAGAEQSEAKVAKATADVNF